MGIQYGQRCGKDIARNFDIAWEKSVLKGKKNLWQEGRTEKEKADYARPLFAEVLQGTVSPEAGDD